MCGRSLIGLIEKLPQVNSCCCGCKLSTGTKIIGWMNLISTIIIEISIIFVIIAASAEIEKNPNYPDDKKQTLLTVEIIVGAVATVMMIVGMALAVMLLIGVHKNDIGKVKRWLMINLVIFIFGVCLSGLSLILKLTIDPSQAIVQLISSVINFGIVFYVIVVVKSYYTEQMAAFDRLGTDQS